MLGVNQSDFMSYMSAFKSNYRKGVHRMEAILANPTHAKEFSANLGGVSVVLGVPIELPDRNSDKLLELLLGFEINKDDWRTLLTGAKARLPEIIARRNDFLQAYQGKRHEYDNLLTYFMYRHFMKALGDDAVQDKVQLAPVSTAVIQLLDVYEWLAKGEVTHWAQICICKAYSREIEYNEDNTEQLAAFSVLDEME